MNKGGSPGQNGMTLIEMMVAMLIGTILIGGAITVYVQSKGNYRTADSVARLQDNLRFALETLEPDVRLAGFWGLHSLNSNIDLNTVAVSCSGANPVAATTMALGRPPLNPALNPIESRDDAYTLPCAGRSPRNGSDVLLLRHASARLTDRGELRPGRVYAAITMNGGQLFDDALPPAPDTAREFREVEVHAYYVGESTFEADVPALRRLSLVDGGAGGQLQDQEVIAGVENLQVQFGLDSNGDMQVDRYVDGDHPAAAPGGARILAVRLWLLVRSDVREAALTDERVFETPDADRGPIRPGLDDGYPPQFRRAAISKTVFLRNGQAVVQ